MKIKIKIKMFQPINLKYRKVHRAGLVEKEKGIRGTEISFGVYGLKVIEGGILRARELSAVRMVIKRGLKKTGNVWLRAYPNLPITGKKIGTRMGKGAGNVTDWVYIIRGGMILIELSGITSKLAKQILEVVGSKLSIKTKIVILKE